MLLVEAHRQSETTLTWEALQAARFQVLRPGLQVARLPVVRLQAPHLQAPRLQAPPRLGYQSCCHATHVSSSQANILGTRDWRHL